MSPLGVLHKARNRTGHKITLRAPEIFEQPLDIDPGNTLKLPWPKNLLQSIDMNMSIEVLIDGESSGMHIDPPAYILNYKRVDFKYVPDEKGESYQLSAIGTPPKSECRTRLVGRIPQSREIARAHPNPKWTRPEPKPSCMGASRIFNWTKLRVSST